MKDISFSSFLLVLILLFLIFILSFNYKKNYKLILVLCIFFWRNLYIVLSIVTLAYQKYYKQISYSTLRLDCKYIFERCFDLDMQVGKLSSPTIFIANYPHNKIEAIVPLFLPCTKLSIIMAENFAKRTKLDKILDNYIIRSESHNQYEIIKKEIEGKIKEGFSVFGYTSKQTYFKDYISFLRKGLFSIAKELNIKITPVYIDKIRTTFGIIKTKKFKVKCMDSFYVKNEAEDMRKVREFFIKERKEIICKE